MTIRAAHDPCVLSAEGFEHYFKAFADLYPEDVVNEIPDVDAWDWFRGNVPFLDCCDAGIEKIYYFRWWIYRKHIKRTPEGFVVTEFLPEVRHGGKYNTINCPLGHQFYEGRWIKNTEYLNDYGRFMLGGGGDPCAYSCWFADGLYRHYCVTGEREYITGLLEGIKGYYRKWEERKKEGLFYYNPWMDGMEFSISGNQEPRVRPSLNSYMYGDALAISKIAALAGEGAQAKEFRAIASALKSKIQEALWNDGLGFFATRDEEGYFMPRDQPVREAAGYIPWYYNLPDAGYETAWRHINDPEGFCTPIGLTSAEVRHPRFLKLNPERIPTWDGPIWPFATSQTLTAMQNLLRNYEQPHVTAADYIRELGKYAASHVRDGKVSISEVVRDPYVAEMKGSEHYNHSTFCDLVITGVGGIVAREDDVLEISPLAPESWDYFCIDGVRYHDHLVAIVWDRTGARYGEKGFRVYVDKILRHASAGIQRVTLDLSSKEIV